MYDYALCDCGHERSVHDSDWGLGEDAPADAEPTSCDIEGCDCEEFFETTAMTELSKLARA